MKPNRKTHWLWNRWVHMRNSIKNPKHPDYPRVGGAGISWDPAFEDFWQYTQQVETHLGSPPPGCRLLARKDQTQDWTITNMEWSTHKVVGRRWTGCPVITYAGQSQTYHDWSEQTGINYHTLRERFIRGWTPEAALTTPAQEYNRPKKYTQIV